MRAFFVLPLLVLLASGCASGGVTERLDSLEAELRQVRGMADQALNAARGAENAASNAASGSDVDAARQLAQRALDTANETAERIARIQEECCGVK